MSTDFNKELPKVFFLFCTLSKRNAEVPIGSCAYSSVPPLGQQEAIKEPPARGEARTTRAL